MPRERFDQELLRLKENVLMVGYEVQGNTSKGVQALMNQDIRLANTLILADEWVNRRQVELNHDALTLIATQQPVARDMRFVTSLIGIVAELERIHDNVKDICIITNQIKGHQLPRPLFVHLPNIAEKTSEMLRQALDAFKDNDLDTTRNIPAGDVVVENLYFETYRLLVQYAADHSNQIDVINRWEWATHSLARIADRTINICEWSIYIMTGDMVEIEARHRPPLVTN